LFLEITSRDLKMTEKVDEQQLRNQVAGCTLMLNDLGILGYSGHVSARLPDGSTFLIQSFDQSRASLTPEALLICDFDGRVVSGPEGLRPPAEVALHAEILRARADVNAVAHFHHDRSTVFTLADGPQLMPVKNHAMRWESGIPVHANPGHVNSAERGRDLVATLANHNAALIRAHGQVIVAEDIPALLIDCVHFVENTDAMYEAALLGPIKPLTLEEIEIFKGDFKRGKHIKKLWKYYVGRALAKGVLQAEWSL
jgi:ribulose-5-phosphate 4-epimerase/fuculose-1-phosphate aldolase